MKIYSNFNLGCPLYFTMVCFILLGYFQSINESVAQENDAKDYVEFKGEVIGKDSNKPLKYATIAVNQSNITVISNDDGEFLLKVPKNDLNKSVTISYLGYENRIVPLSQFTPTGNKFVLSVSIVHLNEINLVSKNPEALIAKLMNHRHDNSMNQPIIMQGFYRESIKKRRTYASLSEAVVEVYKRPNVLQASTSVKLHKLRKSTDYNKVDTLVIKLQGGPYNTLSIDMIKNNDMFFNDDIFKYYKFSFDKAINIDNRTTFVVNFKPNGYVSIPLFYGKLYIDSKTYALSKAHFSLNLDDQKEASRYFVKKKPLKADVLPIKADYKVEYRLNNGKWIYNYSRIELSFKIDWTKRIFNSVYSVTIEKAITDWKINTDNVKLKGKDRLKSNIILNDQESGFADTKFWGEYNVIEPDKSIQNAIKKINRNANTN